MIEIVPPNVQPMTASLADALRMGISKPTSAAPMPHPSQCSGAVDSSGVKPGAGGGVAGRYAEAPGVRHVAPLGDSGRVPSGVASSHDISPTPFPNDATNVTLPLGPPHFGSSRYFLRKPTEERT